ncbi:1-aminocyclopropane-1-carboxylate deaminase/D-cysteine desulfhydrase [Flavihumibacter fluvii]|uniref:1-aminocyclopropane-1-carboxylate deaminase/D-cysteine desulfhydrase n=1 Tax=Flavihumibacter fluvii TaxID=2838157 RepID=UPI001BDE9477|nr:pyridoxal-phosphate dependent enzyme [Flavihumibacter fluvii]ULQ53673.1 pyridoxal-phosphate dependent enzyme [Flavihumibacter fluvii]
MNLSLINHAVAVQPVVLFQEQGIPLDILRLDKIHSVVSGNKWFKLKEWLAIARNERKEGILTMGGAFSNHVVATAFAAKLAGLKSAAIIRGEPAGPESHCLMEARSYGMDLQFISRSDYRSLSHQQDPGRLVRENWLFVPEGGAGAIGVKGAASILETVPSLHKYTHIFCAVGTGTMLAGLSNAALPHQQIVGISSLKGMDSLTEIINRWRFKNAAPFSLLFDYHFGGYAKHPQKLLDFINELYVKTGIPTDIVYTGKMMFALKELLQTGYFSETDNILAIHSGGLQGNRSLKKGQLIFL